MLAAIKLQINQKLEDKVTNGGHSPGKTRMLGLIWLLVPEEATSPTTTETPLQ